MPGVQLMAVSNGASNDEVLRQLLTKNSADTTLTAYGWTTIWQELVNVGIYRRGPDVSEIGSSWLESLGSMNGLRPFGDRELNVIGGENQFLKAAWQNVYLLGGEQVWGIPFRADVRGIFYWRDMLEKAAVDPDTAFRTPQSMEEALEKLQKVYPHPWAPTMNRVDNDTLYYAASWVWANGGDFIAPDGKSVAFEKAEAMEGLRQYYSLRRFCPPGHVSGDLALQLFIRREIPVMIAGPWIKAYLRTENVPEYQREFLGVTAPPGPAYVGGSVLVLWQHTFRMAESLDLIRCLIGRAVQSEYPVRTGLLPVREDIWQQEPFVSDPNFQSLYKILTAGRTLPNVPLWGMIERKLIEALGQVWADMVADPGRSEKDILEQTLLPLARQLNMTLAS